MRKLYSEIGNDEDGMESVQVIMILAIAAVILGLLKTSWPAISGWFTDWVNEIMG